VCNIKTGKRATDPGGRRRKAGKLRAGKLRPLSHAKVLVSYYGKEIEY
jgi:hypothetical protein